MPLDAIDGCYCLGGTDQLLRREIEVLESGCEPDGIRLLRVLGYLWNYLISVAHTARLFLGHRSMGPY